MLVLFISVRPNGLDMDIGDAVKENTSASVACTSNSANPHSSVDIDFFIGATKQSHIKPQVTTTPGTDNGIVKTFVFNFTTARNQHGETATCHLLWDGDYTNTTRENYLNITCE